MHFRELVVLTLFGCCFNFPWTFLLWEIKWEKRIIYCTRFISTAWANLVELELIAEFSDLYTILYTAIGLKLSHQKCTIHITGWDRDELWSILLYVKLSESLSAYVVSELSAWYYSTWSWCGLVKALRLLFAGFLELLLAGILIDSLNTLSCF